MNRTCISNKKICKRQNDTDFFKIMQLCVSRSPCRTHSGQVSIGDMVQYVLVDHLQMLPEIIQEKILIFGTIYLSCGKETMPFSKCGICSLRLILRSIPMIWKERPILSLTNRGRAHHFVHFIVEAINAGQQLLYFGHVVILQDRFLNRTIRIDFIDAVLNPFAVPPGS